MLNASITSKVMTNARFWFPGVSMHHGISPTSNGAGSDYTLTR